MSYEAGSKECRHLIEAKEVHAQLDALLDLLKEKRESKIKSKFWNPKYFEVL